MQQPLLRNRRWLRIVGATIFLAVVGSFAWFVLERAPPALFVRR